MAVPTPIMLPGAYGGGQGSGKGSKLADITAGIGIPGDGELDTRKGLALDKACAQGQKNMSTKKQDES